MTACMCPSLRHQKDRQARIFRSPARQDFPASRSSQCLDLLPLSSLRLDQDAVERSPYSLLQDPAMDHQ